jgi:hypothetical protein
MDTQAGAGYAASWTTQGTSGEKTVTEAEWLGCTDPDAMLEYLRGKATERKLRLFACACCRRIWHLLPDEASRRAVEVAERYADGQVTEEQLEEAGKRAGWAAAWAAHGDAAEAAAWATSTEQEEDWTKITAERAGFAETQDATKRQFQSDLLRDMFGDPFRPVALDPSLLKPSVVKLARTLYEKRTFDCLPILVDALEEAGCSNQDILAHCRSGGEHVRGCWVVDALLGKE